MSEYYLFVKALHLSFVISWMAGMFYLPRLYVYHVDAEKGGELDKTLITMEKRLLRIIINPAMILSLLFGVILVFIVGKQALGGWFHVKVLVLLFMFAIHGMFAKFRKDFERGLNKKSRKFYKIINEVPPILMVIIVLLAMMKPF